MNTENSTEIELWTVRQTGDNVRVVYTVYDGKSESNITQQIEVKSLVKFVKDTEMNLQYVYAVDELTELDSETFTTENLYCVVKEYLLANLK